METHTRLVAMKDGTLAFFSSYDPGLVAALKSAIPYTERRWNSVEKAWIVAPHHGETVAELTAQYLGITPSVPRMAKTSTQTKMLKLEYLGATKQRGNGDDATAYGYVDGEWSTIFPLSALAEWFGVDIRPDEAPTLFAVLGVPRDAAPAQIKAAYRRLARQWHPDVNDDGDAADQFRRVQHAYEVLSNDQARQRYIAGLALADTLLKEERPDPVVVWRSPLRCGWLLVEGVPFLEYLKVEKILQWEDIVDDDGRVMISYWPRDGEQFEVRWV